MVVSCKENYSSDLSTNIVSVAFTTAEKKKNLFSLKKKPLIYRQQKFLVENSTGHSKITCLLISCRET